MSSEMEKLMKNMTIWTARSRVDRDLDKKRALLNLTQEEADKIMFGFFDPFIAVVNNTKSLTSTLQVFKESMSAELWEDIRNNPSLAQLANDHMKKVVAHTLSECCKNAYAWLQAPDMESTANDIYNGLAAALNLDYN